MLKYEGNRSWFWYLSAFEVSGCPVSWTSTIADFVPGKGLDITIFGGKITL
jgi:hypothetical protein